MIELKQAIVRSLRFFPCKPFPSRFLKSGLPPHRVTEHEIVGK